MNVRKTFIEVSQKMKWVHLLWSHLPLCYFFFWTPIDIKRIKEVFWIFGFILGGLIFHTTFSAPLQEADSWEIIEGLKIGQSNVQRPDKHEGFMLKKRKWPLKGWHKVGGASETNKTKRVLIAEIKILLNLCCFWTSHTSLSVTWLSCQKFLFLSQPGGPLPQV